MQIIKDKVLERGKTYYNTKFVRCYNAGARLENCIWESGVWIFGNSKNLKWKGGVWLTGYSFKGDDKWKYGKIRQFMI